MSAQRVKEMVKRFEAQERLKQEILERERQIKRLETREKDNKELKKNIHKKYLRTKYKEKHGTSRWHRENSEETVNKMYNRAIAKKNKFEKLEKEKAERKENELKSLFKPKILQSVKSWENLKRNEDKINKKISLKDKVRVEKVREAVINQEIRFEKDNKNTVYLRMQNDLEKRRERERKRRKLKKFKDLHFKEYTQLMQQEFEDGSEKGDYSQWERH